MANINSDNKIKKITNNKWKFPAVINFSNAAHYVINFSDMHFDSTIEFDLTATIEIHSSFLGFLIDLKRKIDKHKGRLELKMSPYIEEVLTQINLYDHLTSKAS